jgi:cytochrome c oxidase assembly protein Cox11
MDLETRNNPELKARNKRLAFGVLGILVCMEVFPWIYAPLYRQVCATLGIKTATSKPVDQMLQEARAAGGVANGPSYKVAIMGVSGQLPISIKPLQTHTEAKVGEIVSVVYQLKNNSDRDLDYRAIHSTLPANHPSFELIKCFCDEHRVIKAGVTENWPVVFRITKPIENSDGLTVNYTLFNYDPDQKKAANSKS